jgi:hypothetical protein
MAVARYHLGVDFGTCWSKLVLRDYQQRQPTGIVVHPATGWLGRRARGYRIPSGVALEGDRLLFGFSGAEREHRPGIQYYRSLKMRGAFPNGYFGAPVDPPEGFSDFDLCALVVLHLLQIGFAAAKQRAGLLGTPRMGMTLGVPMSLAGSPALRDRFVELARMAFVLHRSGAPDLAAGIRLDHARQLLGAARADVAQRGPATSWREWVRSEAEAGVLWAFRSPNVPPGLYGCADVGAGTTDVSFFRIAAVNHDAQRKEWRKDLLAFYSAKSDIPGIDAIAQRLASFGSSGTGGFKAGDENALIQRHGLSSDAALRAVTDRMFRVHREAWADGYRKEKSAPRWQSLGIFLLGGGNRVTVVADRLSQTVWDNQLPPPKVMDPGVPDDLSSMSGGVTTDDAAFLLVAYGLSFPDVEVPEAMSPDQLAPIDLDREPDKPLDSDEYHPR